MMPTPCGFSIRIMTRMLLFAFDGVARAPEAGRLHLARAAMAPWPGVRVVAVPDGELGEQDGVARLLDRVDHRDDDAERARIGGFLDVALVRGRYAHEGNAPGVGNHLDQLLGLTPGERAVLHLDPDEVHPFAGFLRDGEVGTDDGVAEDLLSFFQLRDDGVERLRTGLDRRRSWPCGLWRRSDLRRRLSRDHRDCGQQRRRQHEPAGSDGTSSRRQWGGRGPVSWGA